MSQGKSRFARSRFSVKVDLPRKWLLSLLASSVISIFLLLANLSLGFLRAHHSIITSQQAVDSEHKEFQRQAIGDAHAPLALPKLAYLILGTSMFVFLHSLLG